MNIIQYIGAFVLGFALMSMFIIATARSGGFDVSAFNVG